LLHAQLEIPERNNERKKTAAVRQKNDGSAIQTKEGLRVLVNGQAVGRVTVDLGRLEVKLGVAFALHHGHRGNRARGLPLGACCRIRVGPCPRRLAGNFVVFSR